jgi:hypothetical protein
VIFMKNEDISGEFRNLSQDYTEIEIQNLELEAKLKELEVKLAKAETDRKSAIELCKSQYQQVTKELFSTPQAQSKKSTVVTTIIGILASLGITQLYSGCSSTELAKTQKDNFQISEILYSLNNDSRLSTFDFSSFNGTSIVYKLIIMRNPRLSSQDKEIIVKALKAKTNSDIGKQINADVLKKWNEEMTQKYQKMLNFVDHYRGSEITENEMYYEQIRFKVSGDSTEYYDKWQPDYEGYKGFQKDSYKNTWPIAELKDFIQDSIDKLKESQSGNNSVSK